MLRIVSFNIFNIKAQPGAFNQEKALVGTAKFRDIPLTVLVKTLLIAYESSDEKTDF